MFSSCNADYQIIFQMRRERMTGLAAEMECCDWGRSNHVNRNNINVSLFRSKALSPTGANPYIKSTLPCNKLCSTCSRSRRPVHGDAHNNLNQNTAKPALSLSAKAKEPLPDADAPFPCAKRKHPDLHHRQRDPFPSIPCAPSHGGNRIVSLRSRERPPYLSNDFGGVPNMKIST